MHSVIEDGVKFGLSSTAWRECVTSASLEGNLTVKSIDSKFTSRNVSKENTERYIKGHICKNVIVLLRIATKFIILKKEEEFKCPIIWQLIQLIVLKSVDLMPYFYK